MEHNDNLIIDTLKKEQLEQTYNRFIQTSINNLSLEGVEDFIDNNVMGYGTTLDEKCLSINDYRKLIERQREQGKNIQIEFSIAPVVQRITTDGNSAIYVDEVTLTMYIENKKHELFLRLTSVFEYQGNKWIVIHWHGSKPEYDEAGTDTWHINEWKQKNAELERLVEEKTADLNLKNRELEIEASLERVRAVAMGMHKSEDLLSICEVSYKEFIKLGFSDLRAVLIHILDDEKTTITDYDYCELYGGEITNLSLDAHPEVKKYFEQIKKSDDAFAEAVFSGKELDSWKKVRIETGQKNDPRIIDAVALYYYGYSIGVGDFAISTFKPTDERQTNILKRFRNVFDLAYRRYVDIELAEAQTREAQIEVALERVRARTMAMQKGNELADAATLLFQQVKQLGIETYSSGFNIWDEKNRQLVSWMSNPSGVLNPPFIMPMTEYNQHARFYKSWKNKAQFTEDDITGERLVKHYQYLRSFPLLDEVFAKSERKGIKTPDRQVHNAVFFSNGYLLFITLDPSPQHHEIFKRFGHVFQQTYTRFLDLQKAEAQAREAQIEASLERVRSLAVGMQKSDEVGNVSDALFAELQNLNVNVFGCTITVIDEALDKMELWRARRTAIVNAFEKTSFKHSMHILEEKMREWYSVFIKAWKSREKYLVTEHSLEERNALINAIAEQYNYNKEQIAKFQNSIPEEIVSHFLFFKIGYLALLTGKRLSNEELLIARRFIEVFDFTYTRFYDLKKAEAQAREAQIEAALERVRVRTMTMQNQNELAETASLLYSELVKMGLPHVTCAFEIINTANKTISSYVTKLDGTVLPESFIFSISEDFVRIEQYNSWKSKAPLLEIALEGNDRTLHIEHITKYVPENIKNIISNSMPNPMYIFTANFSHGFIRLVTKIKLSEEQERIILRAAKVFEQTYIRFLDLQKSEEQRKIIQAENDRKSKELEEARMLQLAMLPKDVPKLSKLDISVYMKTATEVGGDYYDFSFKDNGSLNVCLGDATGHGLKAGTLVSIMKSLFVSESVNQNIHRFFISANDTIKKMALSKMMMAFAMVNIHGNKIAISNAGIPPIYIYIKGIGKVEEININGLPLGAFNKPKYDIYENEVNSGDTILMLSDGFPELMNNKNEMFGYEKLKELFLKIGNKSADEIILSFKEEHQKWAKNIEPNDDITFVVIKIK